MAGNQKKFQIAMTKAEEFGQQNKWNEAARAYRFAMAEFPNNEAAILGFGKASLALGKTDFAWKSFQQALRINPSNHETLTAIGDIQERKGQLNEAAETYLRVGNIFSGLRDFDTAIDYWIRATKLYPGQVEAHRRVVDGFMEQERPIKAARQLLTLAGIYQRRKDPTQAMMYVEEAEQITPNNPGIIAAMKALQEGTPIKPNKISDTPAPVEDSTPDFMSEIGGNSFDPDDDPFNMEDDLDTTETRHGDLLELAQQDALAELANVAFEDDIEDLSIPMLIIQAIDLQRGDSIDEAVNNYQQALKAGMKKSALYFNLGLLLKATGEINEATKMLKFSAQDKKYRISSQFALGETYRLADDLSQAIYWFIELVRTIDMRTVSGGRADELDRMYEELAKGYLSQGDSQKIIAFISTLESFFADATWEKKAYKARQSMDSVSENSMMTLAEYLETPETEVIITTLAVTGEYLRLNLLMTASEECLRAIQKTPDYLPLHMRLAEILLKKEQIDLAVTKYNYIARVYNVRNMPTQTINTYLKILDLAPMNMTVRSDLIELYIADNKVKKALDEYLILADSYYQLAQIDRSLEKFNEALRLASTVSNTDSWKVNILTHIGDIYNQRFDWNKAAKAYRELLDVKPDDEKVQRKLIDLYYKQSKTGEAMAILDRILAMYQRKNPPKGLELLKDLTLNYTDDIYLRQRLAVAFVQNGMNQQAIAEYDTLGEIQLERGMRVQAAQTIQAILNLNPADNEGYRRLLAQISGG